jgi:hypothetical protein
MEDVGIFYAHLVQFTVFCYILWTFGIVRGNLVHFSPFRHFTNLATLTDPRKNELFKFLDYVKRLTFMASDSPAFPHEVMVECSEAGMEFAGIAAGSGSG